MTPAEKYAQDHGVSVRQAQRRLRAEGVEPIRVRFPQTVVDRIVELGSGDDPLPVPMIALDVGLTPEQVRLALRHRGLRSEKHWRAVRTSITKNPALRALHEEIMHDPALRARREEFAP